MSSHSGGVVKQRHGSVIKNALFGDFKRMARKGSGRALERASDVSLGRDDLAQLDPFFLATKDGREKTWRLLGFLAPAMGLIITSLLSICLGIVATSKMWFSHLWKKNSTHARHKKHTKYHPIVKEREFRGQR